MIFCGVNIKAHLIALLLFAFPVIAAIQGAPSVFLNIEIEVIKFLNYMGVVIALLLMILKRGHFSVRALQLTLMFVGLLVINFLMTDYASIKWLFNWLGFLFIFGVLIGVFASIQHEELKRLQEVGFKYLMFFAVTFGSAALFVWISQYSLFSKYITSWQLNSVIALLTFELGIEKQSLGNLGALLIIFIAIARNSMSLLTKLFMTFVMIILMPAFLGIRALITGLAAGLLALLVLRTHGRLLSVALFVGYPSVVYTIFNRGAVTEFVAGIYDRLPSLTFAFHYCLTKPFGLGNGGYHIYVEQYNDLLLSVFGSEKMIKIGNFWLAPESDITYFIASWGILSLIFFAVMAVVIIQGSRLMYKKRHYLTAIEKMIIVYTIVLLLMGVSQDNAGNLLWWSYLGASVGILMRHEMFAFKTHRSEAKRLSVCSALNN